MLRGLYTATAGMVAQQRRHDTITNNIANINTPGFKADNALLRSFPEYMIQRMGDTPKGVIAPRVGRMSQGVFTEEKIPTFTQGDLRETENAFDFALVSNLQSEEVVFNDYGYGVNEENELVYQPQAFFTVVNENGERRYTRNGHFLLNPQGELVTPAGYRVLGANEQPIQFNNRDQIRVDKNGTVRDAITGEPINDVQPFLVSRVENPSRLVREGNGVFRLSDDEIVRPVEAGELVEIHQKHLEGSNVDPTQSMVDMMAALRAYEANQKIIQFYDKSLDKAVNEVGRIY
jgi:flagellar basal-body rod protein FlgF